MATIIVAPNRKFKKDLLGTMVAISGFLFSPSAISDILALPHPRIAFLFDRGKTIRKRVDSS
jgi:hypothetical protein